MALWVFSRDRSPAPDKPDKPAKPVQDERVELYSADAQRRTAYRASIAPSDIPFSRFWLHEPGARFRIDPKGGPVAYVLELDRGIVPVNVSSSGVLLQLAVPPEIKVPRLARQEVDDETDKRFAPFREASFIAHLAHKGEILDVIVTGRIVRISLVRTTQKFNVYELALKFSRWGSITDTNIVWYKLGEGGVPPIAAWITLHQLRRAEVDRRTQF